MDINADVFKHELGKALTKVDGLNMSDVVGDFMGEPVGPTFFVAVSQLMECGLPKTFRW